MLVGLEYLKIQILSLFPFSIKINLRASDYPHLARVPRLISLIFEEENLVYIYLKCCLVPCLFAKWISQLNCSFEWNSHLSIQTTVPNLPVPPSGRHVSLEDEYLKL